MAGESGGGSLCNRSRAGRSCVRLLGEGLQRMNGDEGA